MVFYSVYEGEQKVREISLYKKQLYSELFQIFADICLLHITSASQILRQVSILLFYII